MPTSVRCLSSFLRSSHESESQHGSPCQAPRLSAALSVRYSPIDRDVRKTQFGSTLISGQIPLVCGLVLVSLLQCSGAWTRGSRIRARRSHSGHPEDANVRWAAPVTGPSLLTSSLPSLLPRASPCRVTRGSWVTTHR